MELAKIESLLDAYFEGNTTLAEEKVLRDYFTGNQVASHLEMYQPLFLSIQNAQEEVFTKAIHLPKKSNVSNKSWWYSIAASFIIAVSVAGFMYSESQPSQEEKEALAALQESRKAMLLLSENFNKGVEQLALVNQFTETKNKILK